MTRSEAYDKPGKPPAIAAATINEDLRRRDFTVNAMALSLNRGFAGLLLDPFNGVADIEAKVLRILHNYAFLEDPIRLIRATRLSARFHWPLEERTQARYDAAKENNYIEFVGKRSVGAELEQWPTRTTPSPSCGRWKKKAGSRCCTRTLTWPRPRLATWDMPSSCVKLSTTWAIAGNRPYHDVLPDEEAER